MFDLKTPNLNILKRRNVDRTIDDKLIHDRPTNLVDKV